MYITIHSITSIFSCNYKKQHLIIPGWLIISKSSNAALMQMVMKENCCIIMWLTMLSILSIFALNY